MIELDLSASVQELKRKEVTNIKYKVHEPIEVHLVGNSDLKLDISQSVSYLKEQGCQVKTYHQSNVEFKSIKIVFPDVNAGAIYNIVAIDCKKQSDSKSAAFDFRVKKVSAYGVEKDIIDARRFTNFPYHFNIYLLKRPVP
ncbi:hypothetical protein RhiirA4_515891 [Rhizophagus irregularis]|uniref:Uncharacterized protein n=1 Tax=Rhizophagus irregularis TaxID=588596 RepID=A0A2I1HL50_9GLOM|nr:hypothetical protein RhiirA4_515891 [Rhizophagus irregularis]